MGKYIFSGFLPGATATTMRALVVEDDQKLQQQIRAILDKAGRRKVRKLLREKELL